MSTSAARLARFDVLLHPLTERLVADAAGHG
jgi:hypothetical protein